MGGVRLATTKYKRRASIMQLSKTAENLHTIIETRVRFMLSNTSLTWFDCVARRAVSDEFPLVFVAMTRVVTKTSRKDCAIRIAVAFKRPDRPNIVSRKITLDVKVSQNVAI